MANFKGGFAFNNEAAKVEVEQAPDGTLVSCINPVTGEELGGGGGPVVTTANITLLNKTGGPVSNLLFPVLGGTEGDYYGRAISVTLANNQSGSYTVMLIDGRCALLGAGQSYIPTGSNVVDNQIVGDGTIQLDSNL